MKIARRKPSSLSWHLTKWTIDRKFKLRVKVALAEGAWPDLGQHPELVKRF